MTFYTHWRDVPTAAWRWPNFSPAEIACRGTGKLLVNEAALDKLQALRLRLGTQMTGWVPLAVLLFGTSRQRPDAALTRAWSWSAAGCVPPPLTR